MTVTEKSITISFQQYINHYVTAILMLLAIGFRECFQHEKIHFISAVAYFVLLLKTSDLLTIMLYFWQTRFMMLVTKSECQNAEFFYSNLPYIFEKLQKIMSAKK